MKRYLILFHLMAEFFWWQVHFFCTILQIFRATIHHPNVVFLSNFIVLICENWSSCVWKSWRFMDVLRDENIIITYCSRSLWFSPSSAFLISLSLFKTLASSEAQLINEANQFCQSVGPLSSKVYSALKLVKLSEILFHPQINCKKLQFDEMPVEWGKFFKNVDFFITQTDIISNQIQEKILYNFSIIRALDEGGFHILKLFL